MRSAIIQMLARRLRSPELLAMHGSIIMATSKIHSLLSLSDYGKMGIVLSSLQMTTQWLIEKRRGLQVLVGTARTQIFCCQDMEASLFLGA
jgi:hypothetical protein